MAKHDLVDVAFFISFIDPPNTGQAPNCNGSPWWQFSGHEAGALEDVGPEAACDDEAEGLGASASTATLQRESLIQLF